MSGGSRGPKTSRSDGVAALDAVGAAWTIEAEGPADSTYPRRTLRCTSSHSAACHTLGPLRYALRSAGGGVIGLGNAVHDAGGSTDQHLLRKLVFPARYEALVAEVGADVARLVVEPPEATRNRFEELAEGIGARSEGALVPLAAQSGTGKTTAAQSLVNFFPTLYTDTLGFTGNVTYDELLAAAAKAAAGLATNDTRVIPINIDHRESQPPASAELAAIKRFLREPSVGRRCAVLWPETSPALAVEIGSEYQGIAGKAPIDLPLMVEGPVRESWSGIASATLELSNGVDDLGLLGVDPATYDPAKFDTIGDYLREIAADFTKNRLHLLRSTTKPLRVAIVFASESTDTGVLTQLTTNSRFGLADGSSLINATRESVLGKFWNERRGLLTQMIVQLDLRLLSLPPTASIPILRRHGPEKIKTDLAAMKISTESVVNTAESFSRTDLGRFLLGTLSSTFETRGRPSTVAAPAFALISENKAFTSGQDKALNAGLIDAIHELLDYGGIGAENFKSEKKLDFCPLIPDNSFELNGEVHCIEYTWRKGEFLTNKFRAAVANYALEKLQNYARELGRI